MAEDPHSQDRLTPEALDRRLGRLDPQQVAIWRAMSPARRLDIAFQAYELALDIVRASERARRPDLPADELDRIVARRMQGDPTLGR